MTTRQDPPLCTISIETKTKRAKQLYVNKNFKQCKQLILEIIESGNDENYKLFSKLGDICIELNEYENAEKYYIKSINTNPNNVSIYIKYGNILHEYLNNNNKAQIMYNYAVKIDANNDECWFNFGKLMYKMKNYSRSEHYYLKCIKERACINYHYALLLISYKPSNKLQIKYLLQRATILQPNVVKYHYQYAQYLENIKLKNDAKQQYMNAVSLSQYKDICILYHFAKFLCQHFNDYETAIPLLQIAINLHDINKYKFIQKYYIDIKNKYNKDKMVHVVSESEYKNYYDYSQDDDDGDDEKEKHKKHKKHKKKKKKKKRNDVIKKNGTIYRWRAKIKPKPNGMKILNNLPIRSISKEEENKGIECRICMEMFIFGDKVMTLPCFHWQYHDVCVSKWLNDNDCCPVCLHTVSKVE